MKMNPRRDGEFICILVWAIKMTTCFVHRARRKERAAGGPPSSRHRRRVYSSASSSPAMSHAGILSVQPSPGAGIEPGTSGLPGDELNRGTGSSVAASPVAKRGLNARFQGDPTRADPNTSEGPGAESNRGPRGYEPMARSPQLVTLTERSDEGSAAASMRESVSVSESAINSDSERAVSYTHLTLPTILLV